MSKNNDISLTSLTRYATLVLAGLCPVQGYYITKREAVGPITFWKGGDCHMRITFYIGDFTVTIIVKKRENRHSAK